MKALKLTTVLVLTATLFSCSAQTKTKEEVNRDYVAKAQKYFDVEIADADAEQVSDIPLSVKILKVDSIIYLSSYDVSGMRLYPLAELNLSKTKYYVALNSLDTDGVSSEETIEAKREVFMLKDSLDKQIAAAADLSKKDTAALEILFSSEITYKDGSKEKDAWHSIIFDKQGDIDKGLTDLNK